MSQILLFTLKENIVIKLFLQRSKVKDLNKIWN